MSEHDETLQKTLEELTRLRSEREESLREVASSEYAGRLRYAERIYWLYALACVALGVAAINFFARSFDIKTLIGSAVLMLVLYETTVLMKLWFATARMKLDVLKEMKLLRLEVAELATSVGVEKPSQPPVRYEPMHGVGPWERKLWLAVCAVLAIGVSTWTSHAWQLGGGKPSTSTLVTLAADGSAEEQTQNTRQYSSYFRPRGFSFYTAQDRTLRFLDPAGQEMPVEIVVTGTQARHDVAFTDSAFVEGKLRYTRVSDIPKAAKLTAGVWAYQRGMHHVGRDKAYSITILLPPGAKLLSTEPSGDVKVDRDGLTRVLFEGTAEDGKKHTFTVRYDLPTESEEK